MSLVVILAAIALLAQGLSIVAMSGPQSSQRLFGLLTLMLAIIGVLGFQMYNAGHFLMSPEFGVVMAEGVIAWFGLIVTLITLSLIAGLSLRIARLRAGWHGPVPWFLGSGLIIGILASSIILPLNEQDLRAPTIYSYDLWSPLLMLWITLCLAEALLVILRISGALGRALAYSVVTMAAANWALDQPSLFYSGWLPTQGTWQVLSYLATPFGIGFGIAMILIVLDSRTLRFGAALLGILIALKSTAGSLVFILFVIVATELRRKWTTRYRHRYTSEEKRSHAQQAGLVAVVSVMGFFVYTLFYNVVPLEKSDAFAGVFLTWAVLADLITGGGLLNWCHAASTGDTRGGKAIQALAGRLWQWAMQAGTAIKHVVTADSIAKAGLKLLAGLLLLVMVSELPNAGKLVVEPFATNIPDAIKGSELADRVVHKIRLLSQEVSSDVLLHNSHSRTGPGQGSTAVQETGTASHALANSGSVTVGGVDIPLHVFLWPIQTPLRWVLNAEVISGQLYVDSTEFALAAQSSHGPVWEESWSAPSGESDATVRSAKLDEAITRLSFEIIAQSAWAKSAGMTDSWPAFLSYRQGLAELRGIEQRDAFNRDQYSQLSDAIASFRKAISQDPGFALAYFRLGFALQLDKQPRAARQAFEDSLRVGNDFVPGTNALASNIFEEHTFQPPDSAIVQGEAPKIDHQRARELWFRSISEGELSAQIRGYAYGGLGSSFSMSGAGEYGYDRLVAYYYLSRAVQLFDSLPPELAQLQTIRFKKALALNELGVLLDKETRGTMRVNGWHCYDRSPGGDAGFDWARSRYARYSLEYYHRAAVVAPGEVYIRCNEAAAALTLGNPAPMQALADSSVVLTYLAQNFLQPTEMDKARYQTMLDVLEQAIEHDPRDAAALNSHAYHVWKWYLQNSADPLDLEFAHRVEQNARKAYRMVRAQRNARELQFASTLAEVLLMQNRPHEAVAVLREVEDSIPAHPDAHEIRWEFGSALRCAAVKEQQWIDINGEDSSRGRTVERVRELISEAQKKFDEIRDIEAMRERSLYLDNPDVLDTNYALARCIAEAADEEFEYALAEAPRFGEEAPCGHATIIYEAPPPPSSEELLLHAWGRGLHADARSGMNFLKLSADAEDTQDQYFAQLHRWSTNERGEAVRTPVSGIIPLTTYADCGRNVVYLTFTEAQDAT